ncbi:uncharacterized protein MELLADRAFT_64711 [Melampsora larici-populina 98AG31]|uniref:Uncharacterized protein n=1 Tax=Melampsora larici-populina (strain 98AG31 / pathotype 3-4-7) TaxID=747676 RepID=F4RSH6_MELLP|nr:uncharacterized protein MELLADRAFT_64711 [Melampsora larici-populina 98AG31]EGG04692.1 hypothetical protein MELLADRAFT_64711 [Melampsora larici-populina 98AG31]
MFQLYSWISVHPYVFCLQREIPVALPHQYPACNRTIVVRLAKVNPRTPGLPQRTPVIPVPDPSAVMRLSTLPSTSSQPMPSTPDLQHASTSASSRQGTPSGQKQTEVELGMATPTEHTHAHVVPTPHKKYIDLTRSPSPVSPCTRQAGAPFQVVKRENIKNSPPLPLPPTLFDDATPQGQVSSNSMANPDVRVPNHRDLQLGWPSNSVLVSSLLAWHNEAQTSDILAAWKNHFGHEWKMVPSTVYRYRAWINEVNKAGHDRFAAPYQFQPSAMVGQARVHFRVEFNVVAKVGKLAKATNDEISATENPHER